MLGSPDVYGGGGSVVQIDRYDDRGRWTIAWNRDMRASLQSAENLPLPGGADVSHSLTVQRLLFARGVDIQSGLTLVREFNRDFEGDRTNVRLDIGARWRR